MIAAGDPVFRGVAGPTWWFVEFSHWPMFSRPEDLVRLLDLTSDS
ncbi:MAG TPA: hypothetical protein VFH16_04265 [Rubrobacter sp.]|jgi:hypothetical protein|nr:hypothetical protein [Rubrobacter sp.]